MSRASTMKAVVIDRFVSDYNEIRVSRVPRPVPKDDEVLIQVKAAGVNFVDTLYARGKHQNNVRLVRPPFTLGLEFSGVIVSSPPSNKSGFKAGDRVFGSASGSYAEYLTIPANSPSLSLIPSNWDFAPAAGLAATLPVSYGGLVDAGKLQPGETVLVHAAAGGLGLAAVQIAVARGCRVIGTAGSSSKCAVAKRFGASECINYSLKTDWWREALNLTDERGVDLVFDSVGLVSDSLRCLAHRGRILVVGFAGRAADGQGGKEALEKVAMNRVLLKQAQLIGYRFGETHRRYPEETERIWKELWPLLQSGKIKPGLYDERDYRGLETVPQALDDMDKRRIWGKAFVSIESHERAGERGMITTGSQESKL